MDAPMCPSTTYDFFWICKGILVLGYLLDDSSWPRWGLSRSVVVHRALASSSSYSFVSARIMRWPSCSSGGKFHEFNANSIPVVISWNLFRALNAFTKTAIVLYINLCEDVPHSMWGTDCLDNFSVPMFFYSLFFKDFFNRPVLNFTVEGIQLWWGLF